MESDTAAVGVDTPSSDDAAELSETAVAEDDSSQVLLTEQTYTSEVPDTVSTSGEVMTEHADAGADATAAGLPELDDTMHLSTSADIITDSATATNISSTDPMATSFTDNGDDVAASLPTPATVPSSSSDSVSWTADCIIWLINSDVKTKMSSQSFLKFSLYFSILLSTLVAGMDISFTVCSFL